MKEWEDEDKNHTSKEWHEKKRTELRSHTDSQMIINDNSSLSVYAWLAEVNHSGHISFHTYSNIREYVLFITFYKWEKSKWETLITSKAKIFTQSPPPLSLWWPCIYSVSINSTSS